MSSGETKYMFCTQVMGLHQGFTFRKSFLLERNGGSAQSSSTAAIYIREWASAASLMEIVDTPLASIQGK
jgi:hypothetical protein